MEVKKPKIKCFINGHKSVKEICLDRECKYETIFLCRDCYAAHDKICPSNSKNKIKIKKFLKGKYSDSENFQKSEVISSFNNMITEINSHFQQQAEKFKTDFFQSQVLSDELNDEQWKEKQKKIFEEKLLQIKDSPPENRKNLENEFLQKITRIISFVDKKNHMQVIENFKQSINSEFFYKIYGLNDIKNEKPFEKPFEIIQEQNQNLANLVQNDLVIPLVIDNNQANIINNNNNNLPINTGLPLVFYKRFHSHETKDDKLKDFQTELTSKINIQELSLNLYECNMINDKGVMNFLKGMPVSIKKLIMNFGRCARITGKGLEYIFEHLIDTITFIRLDFRECPDVNDFGFKKLTDKLNSNIETIEFNFESCKEITKDGLNYFAEKIPKSLKKLKLTLAYCINITNECVLKLLEELKNLSIDYLKLDFNFCKNLSLIQISELPLSNVLTTLKIDLSNCQHIYDDRVEVIIKSIPKTVQTLVLSFANNKKLTGIGFKPFVNAEFKLKKFHLNCSGCHLMTDEASEYISEKISNEIISFKLNFSDCVGIKDIFLDRIAKKLNQEGIEDLSLNFSHCINVSDENIKEISFYSPKVKNKLHLNFSFCKKITKIGFTALASNGLSETLKILKLYFKDVPVGDKVFYELGTQIPQNISRLILDFDEVVFPQNNINYLIDKIPEKIVDLRLYLNKYNLFESDFKSTLVSQKQFKELKKFELTIISKDNIWRNLTQIFIHNLTHLKLIFPMEGLILFDQFKIFSDKIPVTLEYLHLEFLQKNLDNYCISEIFQKLPQNVSHLFLKFCGSFNLQKPEIDFENCFAQKIKRLTLGFGYCTEISNEIYVKLFNNLPESLTELNIDVKRTKIKEETLKNLFQKMKHPLSVLRLDFEGIMFQYDVFNEIISKIPESLISFSINIYYTQIQNPDIFEKLPSKLARIYISMYEDCSNLKKYFEKSIPELLI